MTSIPTDTTKAGLAPIGSLWIDGPLSWLEIASVRSFVELGHDYVLYSYGTVPNLPQGAQLRDAREVWANDDIITHAKAGSPAIHADVFRAIMVRDTGRVWVDTDIIALKPFPAAMEWFIGHERDDKLLLGNAVMGAPRGSETIRLLADFLTTPNAIPPWLSQGQRKRMQTALDTGETLNLGDLPWGATGPVALTHFAKETGELAHAQPTHVFFPISFQQRKLLTENASLDRATQLIGQDKVLAVHLYSRWMRKYTKGMRGGVPARRSWIGAWLDQRQQVDYDALEQKTQVKAAQQERSKDKLDRIDPVAFLTDLDERKAHIPGGANISPHGHVMLTTMAKDEGPYILEWVAYHHLLGFTDILVLTNDCTDGTDEMLAALAALGLVSRLDNGPWRDKPPQSRGIARVGGHPLFTRADWHMLIDLDEFLQIKAGDGSVNALIDEIVANKATAMPVAWRFFGSGGNRLYRDEPVVSRFISAAADQFVKGHGVKTIYRPEPFMKLAIHRPHLKPKFLRTDEKQLRWINGSGQVLDGRKVAWKYKLGEAGYDLAQVNHYGVKSGEEYLMRRLRGDVLNNHSKYDAKYFRTFDRNDILDTGAAALTDKVTKLCTRLLRDKGVKQAQALIRERYAAKLARLRASDGYDEQLAELGFAEPGTER
ncbi:MAG: glycosyltransferase family 2 protein [Paracoccus sp. (in: a-proteobacteria)]|uniref:glycosyltransferase family 2 protein n=1 Tax=Paracoccus sp. TaxID=267 RepID=UPI0026DEEC5E|nr:glycosyltransferase family 2 protein [Paracoccus sp. (in: a-proteobacteria)]MDO5631978.1 glycosyltransferase family 2 protein [Paracoccus sp. (in: a-proteobacteria)]